MPTQEKLRGKTRLKMPSFDAFAYDDLDGRRAVVKKLRRRASELLKRTKRSDSETLERCRRVAYLELAVQSAEVNSLNTGVAPDGIYIQSVNTLERLYAELGIDPNEQQPIDLDAIIAAKTK